MNVLYNIVIDYIGGCKNNSVFRFFFNWFCKTSLVSVFKPHLYLKVKRQTEITIILFQKQFLLM